MTSPINSLLSNARSSTSVETQKPFWSKVGRVALYALQGIQIPVQIATEELNKAATHKLSERAKHLVYGEETRELIVECSKTFKRVYGESIASTLKRDIEQIGNGIAQNPKKAIARATQLREKWQEFIHNNPAPTEEGVHAGQADIEMQRKEDSGPLDQLRKIGREKVIDAMIDLASKSNYYPQVGPTFIAITVLGGIARKEATREDYEDKLQKIYTALFLPNNPYHGYPEYIQKLLEQCQQNSAPDTSPQSMSGRSTPQVEEKSN